MAINRIELKDFLVFKREFATEFCSGVNVLIGENGTGKTTLLKLLYAGTNIAENENWGGLSLYEIGDYFNIKLTKKVFADFAHYPDGSYGSDVSIYDAKITMETAEEVEFKTDEAYYEKLTSYVPEVRISKCGKSAVYIPVMEMLSISKGLLALYHDRDISFPKTEIDIIAKAEKGATKEITNNALQSMSIIAKCIGGEVIFDGKTFFIKKDDGTQIPFSLEASGFKKLGLLWEIAS